MKYRNYIVAAVALVVGYWAATQFVPPQAGSLSFASSAGSEDRVAPPPREMPEFEPFHDGKRYVFKCEEQVVAELESMTRWYPTGPWVEKATFAMDGSVTYASPTNQLGLWLEMTMFTNKEIQLKRVTPKYSKSYNFDPSDCSRTTSTYRRDIFVDRENAYTDHDLLEELKNNEAGIIYIWSPRMPYSRDFSAEGTELTNGLDSIQKVADQLGLKLTVLMDPAVPDGQIPGLISSRPESSPLTEEMFRPVQALSMVYLGAGMHFPVVMFYSNRRLSSKIYPGLSTVGEYLRFFCSQFPQDIESCTGV